MQTEDTVLDLMPKENVYVRASTGKRLANYLIDVVSFYVVILAAAFAIAIASPESIDAFVDDESAGSQLLDRILTLLFYALFMSVVEALFRGKSLGKLITGTRAVNLDGSQISATTAFGRGFSRAVPFCVFSAFGTPCDPWQDRWNDTMVIDEKESTISH
jgi:uncharacterized RDD family membrane protein YckC